MDENCVACGGKVLAPIHTYKSVWRACGTCGAIRRERKASYLAHHIPGVDRVVRGEGMRRILLGEASVRERPSAFYDYYRDSCARGAGGTKWENEYDVLEDELGRFGFSLDVPRLLDVSGGPGFLAQKLTRMGVDVVVTEFSPYAVSAMEEVLGVKARTFDYNVDELPSVLSEANRAFDAVLVRYSLNFCLDLPRFAAGAASVVEKNGLLYLSYARPTLGCVIHWGHDEYTYNVLYPSEYVRGVFEHAGFQFVGEVPSKHKGYDWRRGFDWRMKTFVFPYLTLALANVSLRRFRFPSFADIASLRTETCEEVYRRR